MLAASWRGEGGPSVRANRNGRVAKTFLFSGKRFFAVQQNATKLPNIAQRHTLRRMSFQSLPIAVREVKATEVVLERLYNAARLGLKGDALALHAGLLPVEFRRLAQMDPVAEYAVQKGHADAEAQMAQVVQTAAVNGDAKMALEYLKHRADWTAAQKVEVTGSQAISITLALEQAQARVNAVKDDADVIDVEPTAPAKLTNQLNAAQALQTAQAAHAATKVRPGV
jgi:hypothetical protein